MCEGWSQEASPHFFCFYIWKAAGIFLEICSRSIFFAKAMYWGQQLWCGKETNTDQNIFWYKTSPQKKTKEIHLWHTVSWCDQSIPQVWRLTKQKAPDIPLHKHWTWPLEQLHRIFYMIQHCLWKIYIKIKKANFTFSDTILPLSLLSNLGTALITQAHSMS